MKYRNHLVIVITVLVVIVRSDGVLGERNNAIWGCKMMRARMWRIWYDLMWCIGWRGCSYIQRRCCCRSISSITKLLLDPSISQSIHIIIITSSYYTCLLLVTYTWIHILCSYLSAQSLHNPKTILSLYKSKDFTPNKLTLAYTRLRGLLG